MKKIIMILVVMIIATQNVNWYYYNWKEYNIIIPKNVNFAYYENCYMSWICKVPKKIEKLITINIMLVKKWLSPLY